MPQDFEFPLVPGQLNRSEVWVPMSFTNTELIQGAGNWSYYLVGRLKPGVTPVSQLLVVYTSAERPAHHRPTRTVGRIKYRQAGLRFGQTQFMARYRPD